MRKFTVTTTILRHATVHKIRRPSKDIQLGDLIEFKFSNDTARAVVKQWGGQKCDDCVLGSNNNKLIGCVRYIDSDTLVCSPEKGLSFVFASIDSLMEEI